MLRRFVRSPSPEAWKQVTWGEPSRPETAARTVILPMSTIEARGPIFERDACQRLRILRMCTGPGAPPDPTDTCGQSQSMLMRRDRFFS